MNKHGEARAIVAAVWCCFVLVTINSSDEVLSSSEVDGGGQAAVCDTVFDICLGSCWKSGECLRCCKHHGFVHGKCSLKHGDACYCCHNPEEK